MKNKNFKKLFSMPASWHAVVAVMAFLFATPLCAQTIRYVKPVAEGDGSGSSWGNASADIQAMVNADGTEQVWVAEGTYISLVDGLIMKNNVAIYGGFPATGTPIMEDRDWATHTTILSGSDVRHVVYNNFTETDPLDNTAILDGFTLSGGGNIAEGGGMYNHYASPTVANVIITDNTVFTNGAGVYNLNSSPIFTNVTINDNSCVFGGGMYNFASSPTLTDVQITDNTTQAFGAGVYNSNDSSLTLNNVVISNNDAQAPGGAIYNSASSVTATGVTLDGNTTTAVGGGIYNVDSAILTLTNANIINNTASSPGGGIYSTDSSVTINVAVINNNTSSTANGGGIYFTGGSLDLIHVLMDGNSATAPGGAISVATSVATLEDVTLNNNTAGGPGGGIYNSMTPLIMLNVAVTNNSGVIGGGIYNDSEATLTNVTVSGNSATGGPGGGIYNADSATIFTNVSVTGNHTTNAVGGGIYNSNAPATFTNVTVSGNSSTAVGGGIFNGGANIVVRNSIVYGNSSGVESDTDVTYEYSLVQGVMDTDNGNISGDTDPLFVDAPEFSTAPFTGGNYSLQGTSPAVNAGNTTYFEAEQTPDLSDITTDVVGNERIQSFGIEMGAYEIPCNTPQPEGDASQSVCVSGTIADLVVDGTDIVWYDAETEGNILEVTTALTNGTTYYVTQTLDACESERKAIAVTIDITPLPGGDENQNACVDATLGDLAVTGSNLVWYDAASEGSVLESTTLVTDGNTYYVSQAIDGCESERKAINVAIVTIDATAELTGNTLSVAQDGAEYQWVDCNNGNQPIDDATDQSYTATAVGDYAVIVTLNGCEAMSDCVPVNEILGVNGNKLQNDVVLYPNPATSVLNINTNTNITAIAVVDVLGKTVLSGSVNNNTVDVSALQPGVYVISLTSGDNTYTQKFIKQ